MASGVSLARALLLTELGQSSDLGWKCTSQLILSQDHTLELGQFANFTWDCARQSANIYV